MSKFELVCATSLLLLSSSGLTPHIAQQAVAQDSAEQQQLHSLTVEVHGAVENTGQILASLFSSEQDFLKQPLLEAIAPIDENGSAKLIFSAIASGTYAISTVYDKDLNGKLNTGFLGIPKELVGFSNNAKGRFGPPPFRKTSFELRESKTIDISLRPAKDKD